MYSLLNKTVPFNKYGLLFDKIENSIFYKNKTRIGYINHHSINLYKTNEIFKKDIDSFDTIFMDGIGIWFAAKILNIDISNRFNWTDVAYNFL